MVLNVRYGKVFAAAVVIGLLIMGAVYALMPVRTWDFEVVPVHSRQLNDPVTYTASVSGWGDRVAYAYRDFDTGNTSLMLYDISLQEKVTLATISPPSFIGSISMYGNYISFYMENTTGTHCMVYSINNSTMMQISLTGEGTRHNAHPDVFEEYVVYSVYVWDIPRYELRLVNLLTGERTPIVAPNIGSQFGHAIYGTIYGDRVVYAADDAGLYYYTISTAEHTKMDSQGYTHIDHDGDMVARIRTYYAQPNLLYLTDIEANTTNVIANNMGWNEPYQITKDRIVYTSGDPYDTDLGTIYLYDIARDLNLPLTDESFSNKVDGLSFQNARGHSTFGSYTAVVVSNSNYSEGDEIWLMKFVYHESTAISSVFGGQVGGLTMPQVSLVVMLITGAAIMTIYFTMKGEEDKIEMHRDRPYSDDRRRRW